MIPAMQEFNFKYGVDSYLRVKMIMKTKDAKATQWRLRVGRDRYFESFSDNPNAQYKFFVDGLERSDGVPFYNSTPNFTFPIYQNNITLEIRANGPYIEKVKDTYPTITVSDPYLFSLEANHVSEIGY